jgi:hypothetical protein
MGPAVLPLLRQVHPQPAGVQQQAAAKCIQLIEKDTPNTLPLAAPRLLVLHRADKSLETLLSYLPFADNDMVASEVMDLIGTVGFKDGKPEPALLAALDDKVAIRRGGAVVALGQEEWDDQKAAFRKMLKDSDPEVRLRVTQSLIGLKDKEAVPELINLFSDLPQELAWEAEDLLARMAGTKNPNVPFAADAAARAKCKDAWAAWWKENGDKVELVRSDLRQRMLGYTLLVEGFVPAKGLGRITELDTFGKVRWQIEGLNYPIDAQVLPGERVLVAEQNQNRVSERDRTGKVLWEKTIAQPFVVRRERNGNTFIATRNNFVEVDRNGKEVYTLQAKGYVMSAMKLRDGQIAYVTNQMLYYRVDSTGKELKQFRIPNQPFGINFWEVLPNDHVMIVTQLNQPQCKIIELDPDGKQVWEANVQACATPTRLPNGNTLVPANNFTRIVELDRNGKVRSEMKDLTGYQMVRVSRR